MTTGPSIFPTSEVGPWAEYLSTPTPVESHEGHWYKREDAFAPLGYGRVNGAKLRQLIYLVDGYVAGGGDAGVVTGASVLSPQLPMATIVAKHYGLPTVIVVGGTTRESLRRHPGLAVALDAGADVRIIKVGYNPTLQRAVSSLASDPEFDGWYRLAYGITTPDDASDAAVAAFHLVASAQVANLPPSVRELLVPMGSANSLVGVLLGLAIYPNNVERVAVFGIGPARLEWLRARLEAIGRALGLDAVSRYRPVYHSHKELQLAHRTAGDVTLEHFDLHTTGYATYQDRHPFTADGIAFHPTYEGKVMTYLEAHEHHFESWHGREGRVCFWIVGSALRVR